MPANLPAEFYKLQEAYSKCKDLREKIEILREMLSVIPKHKGTEKVRADIKIKISKFRKELRKAERKKKLLGKKFVIKKEGAAQVCLVGTPNSGKSFFLREFCNKKIESSAKPFETKKPEVGTLDFEGVKIQVIEMPSIFPGWHKKCKYVYLLHSCDLILALGEKFTVYQELKNANVRKDILFLEKITPEAPEKIWSSLGLIKVYTKTPRGKIEEKPIALPKGARVRELAEKIHKDFLKNFEFARIWGNSVKFPGQRVGLDHELKDGDVVEFHLRKS